MENQNSPIYNLKVFFRNSLNHQFNIFRKSNFKIEEFKKTKRVRFQMLWKQRPDSNRLKNRTNFYWNAESSFRWGVKVYFQFQKLKCMWEAYTAMVTGDDSSIKNECLLLFSAAASSSGSLVVIASVYELRRFYFDWLQPLINVKQSFE